MKIMITLLTGVLLASGTTQAGERVLNISMADKKDFGTVFLTGMACYKIAGWYCSIYMPCRDTGVGKCETYDGGRRCLKTVACLMGGMGAIATLGEPSEAARASMVALTVAMAYNFLSCELSHMWYGYSPTHGHY